jgi:hypothetical protein
MLQGYDGSNNSLVFFFMESEGELERIANKSLVERRVRRSSGWPF